MKPKVLPRTLVVNHTPCRIRTNSNFMGVINRATLRVAVHPRPTESGVSVPQRGTCLASGSLDTKVMAHFNRHRQKRRAMVYKK